VLNSFISTYVVHGPLVHASPKTVNSIVESFLSALGFCDFRPIYLAKSHLIKLLKLFAEQICITICNNTTTMLTTTLLATLAIGNMTGAPIQNTSTQPGQSVGLAPDKMTNPLPRRGVFGAQLAGVPEDVRTKLNLKSGEGAVIQSAVPGYTAEKAGLKPGDVLLAMNGTSVAPANAGEVVRGIPSGSDVTFTLVRDGNKIEVKSTMVERKRDPGTADYEVVYSHILSNGQRMRTIITKPKAKGKHPGFFFIQGFSPISYDYVLDAGGADLTRINAPMLADFAKSGFVTIRVEKPGVGDSEGGPFADVDYTTELDIYRQTLKQLKAMPEVDTDNIFIFGHSMGGAFGPMIADESPVKGIAVYGTASRTWAEYLMETLRTQNLLAGATHEQVDDTVRLGVRVMAQVFMEGKTAEQVKKEHPELAAYVDSFLPGGYFNGKTTKFWAQLGDINFARYWSKCKSYVFSARGASDFVTYDSDHTLIADAVNKSNPGKAVFVSVPSSDHLFNNWPSEKESQVNWPKGTFNMAFSNQMKAWIMDLISKKS
jgi:pimeloyl-ACP methyl ester carboxylesterase